MDCSLAGSEPGRISASVRGFTLVELLVTILVMATLMGVSFRLMHAGDESVARSQTQNRLQRLQNCLVGYHAAFGHYPAVPLHASRDFFLKVNDYGIQTDERDDSTVCWRNVRAALLAQPVTVEFPFDEQDAEVKADVAEFAVQDVAWSKAAKKKGGDPTAVAVYAKEYKPFSAALVSSQKNAEDWRGVQVFRYGLLSFLLPRSEFMWFGEKSLYEDFAAWWKFNDLAEYYCPDTGKPLKSSWAELTTAMRTRESPDRDAVLASISQAACARWLPNLAGTVRGGGTFFGVDTFDGKLFREREHDLRDAEASDLFVHASGTATAPKTGYVLDGMTVLDGWESEFYYYSPPPHRMCRIWSAGSDRKTFPPWVDPQQAAKDPKLKAAFAWTRDDIVVQLQ